MNLTDADREKLQGYYSALQNHQKTFEEAMTRPRPMNVRIEGRPVQGLAGDLKKIEADFPGLLPPFNVDDFEGFRSLKGRPFYENAKVQSYLSGALSKIKLALEQ